MTPGKINPNDNSSNVDVPTSSFEGIHNNNETHSDEVLDNRKLTFALTCDISSTTDKTENGTKPKEVIDSYIIEFSFANLCKFKFANIAK